MTMDGRASQWVAAMTGARSVRAVRSLTFGVTSTLTLVDADGELLVVRTYDPTQHPDAEAGAVGDEVRALAAAQPVLGDLVPRLVAADPSGLDAGCPAVLMTYLPGRPIVADVDPDQMAATLAKLHAAPVPSDLPEATQWFHEDRLAVPSWTEDPGPWHQLVAMLGEPAPSGPAVFLHRDFHQGNVLWTDGRISGVVDWPPACGGPRGIDVAHTRANLAVVNGVDTADRFLAAYTARVPGHHHERWWDAGALFVHVQEAFTGILAFNGFGAELGIEQLSTNADRFARSLSSDAGRRSAG